MSPRTVWHDVIETTRETTRELFEPVTIVIRAVTGQRSKSPLDSLREGVVTPNVRNVPLTERDVEAVGRRSQVKNPDRRRV